MISSKNVARINGLVGNTNNESNGTGGEYANQDGVLRNSVATSKKKKKKSVTAAAATSSEDEDDILAPSKTKATKKKKKGASTGVDKGDVLTDKISSNATTTSAAKKKKSSTDGDAILRTSARNPNVTNTQTSVEVENKAATSHSNHGPAGRGPSGRAPPGRGMPPGRGRGQPGGRTGPAGRGNMRPSSMVREAASGRGLGRGGPGRGPGRPENSARRMSNPVDGPNNAGRSGGPPGSPRRPQSMVSRAPSTGRGPLPGAGPSRRVNTASGVLDDGSYHLPGLGPPIVDITAARGAGRGSQHGQEIPRRTSVYSAPPGPSSNSIAHPTRPNSMVVTKVMDLSNHQSLPPPPGASGRSSRKNSMFRTSSHRRVTPGSTHKTSAGPVNVRVNADGTLTTTSRHNDYNSSFGEYSSDEDDMLGSGGDGHESAAVVSGTPGGIIESFSKSISNFVMDASGRSGIQGLGTSSHHSRHDIGDRRAAMAGFASSQSTRSILTADLQWHYDDNRFIHFLRYIRILPPHPDEKPVKRRIRIVTWMSLLFDLTAAIVAITTYGGVSTCCGMPILDVAVAGAFNWNTAIRVTTYVYVLLILMEILPVVRDGFPFNLLNPLIGFLITFAVFFDDHIAFAATMWIIEALAVSCEFYVFRLRSRVYNDRERRLLTIADEMDTLRSVKKKVKAQYDMECSRKSLDIPDDDDDSAIDDSSFHDEIEDGCATVTDISKVREVRLLRERRILRKSQVEDRVHLRYHSVGVAVNIFLACLSLLLICTIGRNGGLCLVDMTMPNVFKNDQLDRCYECQGTSGTCEVCHPDGTSHCYFPYG